MRGTVVNTPGYYYAISYWLSALVMILVHGCGKKDVWKYVYGVLSFISIFTVMFFTDGIKQMFFMPLMVCVFLLMLLYIRMAGELHGVKPDFSVRRHYQRRICSLFVLADSLFLYR